MKSKAKPNLVDVMRSDERIGSVPRQVSFDYIKGTQFRTIHPDGAIGGAAPPNRIQVAFFCERQAIPQRVTHALNADGSLGETVETVGRDAVVREIDLVVSLTRETAQGLISFLTKALATDRPSQASDVPAPGTTRRKKSK